ncbi:MAG: hypothetical protein EBR82_42020 [Caulobacteraceae bacterium]|nr:hypothetical protein [Caulobacteraceae bacterium]
MSDQIEIPQSVAELIQDPQRIKDALEILNALVALQIKLTTPQGSNRLANGVSVIQGDFKGGYIIPLPLQSANSWAAATGTATRTTFATSTVTTAQLAERVKALIDDLQSVRILPGS